VEEEEGNIFLDSAKYAANQIKINPFQRKKHLQEKKRRLELQKEVYPLLYLFSKGLGKGKNKVYKIKRARGKRFNNLVRDLSVTFCPHLFLYPYVFFFSSQ